ncbi:guanylate kinase [Kordiimonas sp. SCSIO 12610]|uniref:guanylate kinase n=1 Tax=Kordiimonas sp. SCSIO 12610 TaxID=2829597 RepID=UPI00210EF67D|nr:guanylate kinase [Kordiimonas sp. SCSIO 12610]UTW53871.1 guanylate kinase [Kordiimonas sp. SCSIO 12610]
MSDTVSPEINANKRRGLMLVMSSPSGAGKTTLSRMLLADEKDMVMSVSATTREARPGEESGKDYYFVGHDRFREMIDNNELLEHAVVFENRYGTPRGPVMQALSDGKDVLFDIDWQGTQQLAESAGGDLVRVFVLPPSIAELENRLKKRAQDSEEVVQKRMAEAESEISHWAEYDYVLINNDLDKTYADLRNILNAERLRRHRRPALSEFVRTLKK